MICMYIVVVHYNILSVTVYVATAFFVAIYMHDILVQLLQHTINTSIVLASSKIYFYLLASTSMI
jgi:hypothetical protein